MFFRRRYWFNKHALSKYTSNTEHIEASVMKLYRHGFLKNDEDAVYESDIERINELVENGLTVTEVKILETEIKKVVRGNIGSEYEQDFDLIHVNSFHQPKCSFEGIFKEPARVLSHKISQMIRNVSDENIKGGKKILFFRDN